MWVPGRTGRIRRYHVARRRIRMAVGAGAAFGLLLLVLTADYVRVRTQVWELGRLREETSEQRQQIVAYADRMREMSDQLVRLGEFDRKLRTITNLDPGEAVLPGIGGMESGLGPITGLTRGRRHEVILEEFDRLGDVAEHRESSLQALIAHLEGQTARLAATPSIAPTKGWVTSEFGYRTSPFTGGREFHRGIDIAGRMGTPVLAPADGTVRFAGNNRALGNSIVVKHGYGIESLYGHLAEVFVKPGQEVARGERIGLMGSTGRSTGPHLHYQVNVNRVAVDPRNYILD